MTVRVLLLTTNLDFFLLFAELTRLLLKVPGLAFKHLSITRVFAGNLLGILAILQFDLLVETSSSCSFEHQETLKQMILRFFTRKPFRIL